MKHWKLVLSLSMVLAATPVMGQDFIYLFPSKEIAETGEDLFFKAYLLNRQTMALSDKSRTLYLEIRSERDSLVWSEKYPLVGGRGDGHIYIGENWPLGEYFLEGYAKTSFSSDSTEALRPRRIRVVDRVNRMEEITARAIMPSRKMFQARYWKTGCTSRTSGASMTEWGSLSSLPIRGSLTKWSWTMAEAFPSPKSNGTA